MFFGLVFVPACKVKQAMDNNVIIWINSAKVPCTGVGPMHCMQVQYGDQFKEDNWQLFYDQIINFKYQPGYIYKLEVQKTELNPANLPADASSVRYTLANMLEKQADKRLRIHDIWALKSLNSEAYDASKTNKHPTLEFNTTEMRVFGNDRCNNIFGGIETLTDQKLKFGMIAGTRMACLDMEISNKFNTALAETESYTINNMTLQLYNAQGDELITIKKVD